jgi:hypothetical protein
MIARTAARLAVRTREQLQAVREVIQLLYRLPVRARWVSSDPSCAEAVMQLSS